MVSEWLERHYSLRRPVVASRWSDLTWSSLLLTDVGSDELLPLAGLPDVCSLLLTPLIANGNQDEPYDNETGCEDAGDGQGPKHVVG